ncbi:hypothetical protein [Pseudoduganella sp.]|uniref:hypothetical protein n=1 Tax=Pseudoduganella sp. TaxID=1880898 RepID=UPI0035B032A9
MDIEERMAKVETDAAVLKEAQRFLIQEMNDLKATMDHGFAEQRAALAEQRVALTELRDTMERGFAEQRAALAEERAARERALRWTFSAILAVLALVLGLVARMAGVL